MSPAPSLQLAADGRLRHLLTLEGLPASTLEGLLAAAEIMKPRAAGGTALRERLAGRTVCTLFFETSTRTRSSFHLAATRLGADVLNFDVATSSTRKGESALDTMRTLAALNAVRVRAVVQAGGSVRDDEVIAAANAAGITMYFTGARHFFH